MHQAHQYDGGNEVFHQFATGWSRGLRWAIDPSSPKVLVGVHSSYSSYLWPPIETHDHFIYENSCVVLCDIDSLQSPLFFLIRFRCW